MTRAVFSFLRFFSPTAARNRLRFFSISRTGGQSSRAAGFPIPLARWTGQVCRKTKWNAPTPRADRTAPPGRYTPRVIRPSPECAAKKERRTARPSRAANQFMRPADPDGSSGRGTRRGRRVEIGGGVGEDRVDFVRRSCSISERRVRGVEVF